MAKIQGIPVPETEIDDAMTVDPEDAPQEFLRAIMLFLQGARAAEQGSVGNRAAKRGALRDLAARARVDGDSATARLADGAGRALDGLLAWKRGDLELAEELLDEARVEAVGHGPRTVVNQAIRWWLGEILVEQGKFHEAEPYFESLRLDHTMADRRLGEIYVKSGETEKAREAFERFLVAWRDSEPEMQPLVARARQSLAGLAPLRRE